MSIKAFLAGAVMAGIAAIGTLPAAANEYPERPINLIIGFGAGSATDAIGRFYAMQAQELLGVPVVVLNRPGAAQFIAINELLNSPPDGYTLVLATGSALSQGAGVRDDLPYDAVSDYRHVAMLATASGVFTTTPSLPINDMAELFDYAREHPNELNFGSSGVGSASHLQIELLMSIMDLDMAHIPYAGSGEITTAIMMGETHLGIGPIQGSLAAIRGEQVRPLAVTGSERSPLLPDVPALAELEIPELGSLDPYTYYTIIAHRDTPQDIVDTLNAAFNEISETEEAERYLGELGFIPRAVTPQDALEFVENDIGLWRTFREETGFEWVN